MLVDNARYQQPPFLSSTTTFQEYPYPTDLNDIFDTELYNSAFVPSTSSSIPSSNASASRDSSPQTLLTPPQDISTFFPDVHDDENRANSFFNIFEEELKGLGTVPMPSASFDFMGIDTSSTGGDEGIGNYPMSFNIPMDLSTINLGIPMPPSLSDPSQSQGIDPQLVDTPSAISDHGDDESDDKESPESPVSEKVADLEKPTITIAPIKVGGHGKSRKGTIQSGGVTKKTGTSLTANREKENSSLGSSSVLAAAAKRAALVKHARTSSLLQASSPSPFVTAMDNSSAGSEAGDKDDEEDLPQDWRPSPEVFAKMTSKEKRQLRNKISARNFRIRRKEYISTLEGDIAERDRLLDHFRTQLGTRESENLALRQEIAALKETLLEGRGGTVNLPPPAPLPEHSAAEVLAASAASSLAPPLSSASHSTSLLLTPNTQKDLPTSSRMGSSFWGGVGMGGGITPVHTTLVPDISTILRKGLMENMNPALNVPAKSVGTGSTKPGLGGFEGFADSNLFTMKTLDAYRMHLWGKMATQHSQSNQHTSPTSHLSGLAGTMRPHYFSSSSKSSSSSHTPLYGGSTSLSALLSGKHAAAGSSSYPTPPTSPVVPGKVLANSSSREKEHQQREKEHQHAMLAAMASQTIFKKLGSAFWDAFTGGSSSSSGLASNSAGSQQGTWDVDKVKKVLEGKAVLKVVDIEPSPSSSAVSLAKVAMREKTMGPSSPVQDEWKKCSSTVCDLLEESMRSLTLGKKM